ncbi:N-acetylmuramoyl-L-alanine amidase [uncultured Cedecea sp.]|uniref:N-acetylmuramoyl-L-alanine amidase n=1 Tax=uncultured Cedecea sp. TaxID=988762 RepID=UPI00261E6336|nr:N-acetylmuramoyl-L-alanine amidase [uncultured Cedecea sp.]
MYSRMILWCVMILLTGCAGQQGIVDKGEYQVDLRHPARASYPRVKVVVIHYTADHFHGSLRTLTGPDVSSHYLIPAQPPHLSGKPVIWQLVPEQQLAWHAGVSYWRGNQRINDISVGIELENSGFTQHGDKRQFYPFAPSQIAVLEKLLSDIIERYQIAPENIVAHGDIAPQRKVDPGPLFPWEQLAERGIGAWPSSDRVAFYLNGRSVFEPVDQAHLLDLLARYGYQVTPEMTAMQLQQVITAFQMHFRPQNYSGQADAETQAIVEALLEKYGQG